MLSRATSARAFASAASLGPHPPGPLTVGPGVVCLACGVEPPGTVVTGDPVERPLEGVVVGRCVAPAVPPAQAASTRPTVTVTAARTPRTPRR
jgi:hypothetical protein